MESNLHFSEFPKLNRSLLSTDGGDLEETCGLVEEILEQCSENKIFQMENLNGMETVIINRRMSSDTKT